MSSRAPWEHPVNKECYISKYKHITKKLPFSAVQNHEICFPGIAGWAILVILKLSAIFPPFVQFGSFPLNFDLLYILNGDGSSLSWTKITHHWYSRRLDRTKFTGWDAGWEDGMISESMSLEFQYIKLFHWFHFVFHAALLLKNIYSTKSNCRIPEVGISIFIDIIEINIIYWLYIGCKNNCYLHKVLLMLFYWCF